MSGLCFIGYLPLSSNVSSSLTGILRDKQPTLLGGQSSRFHILEDKRNLQSNGSYDMLSNLALKDANETIVVSVNDH